MTLTHNRAARTTASYDFTHNRGAPARTAMSFMRYCIQKRRADFCALL